MKKFFVPVIAVMILAGCAPDVSGQDGYCVGHPNNPICQEK